MESPPDRAAAHPTFPLTFQALTRSSLTPEFNYSEASNARIINARLRPSFDSFTPAEFTAIGLIGRTFVRLIENYLETNNPALFTDLDSFLLRLQEPSAANNFLDKSLSLFPTSLSYYSPDLASSYLFSTKNTPQKRHSLYVSLLLIYTAGNNPSIRKYENIFTDPAFINSPDYQDLFKSIEGYFSEQQSSGNSGINLLHLLDAPARAHPDSLEDQLNYIRSNWEDFLGQSFLDQFLRSLDLFQEENKHSFSSFGPAESPLAYSKANYLTDKDLVRFSHDRDWMPKLILIAKNVFVWLDQLSRTYHNPITRLDQIPDEELALLSTWGITGLWLIGLWERSSASQKIKQICGNKSAIPSAYSLYDYSIAESLGGESAYQNLSERALSHNIRLAADMVPNHMGIYSKWLIEHPERFLSLDKSPFPNYVFSGPNLSEDPRVGIYIDDHYYNQADAAVVFKRVDHHTGTEIYIYHGNDGTAMPWNDTAQLNFLNTDTREAVIQSILHVARKFSIIRFDAAMTLAKKHYQRLWFPEPGAGGAIPTRSEHGLSKEQFDSLMPAEFWQEVVDRVAKETPDTLLLAEAFWMMEGYFVRSLGMHRVYNSAFMHMLRDEDNQKYRDLIIKTLEFDPQILKRYVNFMNNPDEETALVQFGTDGKYFGICVLMATLPGLPMFGHGQIEGHSEKYGMEYQRALYDEKPNQELIRRHEKEIFPLLKKRYLFAEVENFYLFDVTSSTGKIKEDVFAFSNQSGTESALVVYHNKWGHAAGTIHFSTSINGCSISLLDALDIMDIEADYLLFREHISGLEYIRPVEELFANGLDVSLGSYQYQVFLDFKLVKSDEDSYHQLHQFLKGSGTDNLQDDLLAIKYESLLSSITELIGVFSDIPIRAAETSSKDAEVPNDITESLRALINSINISFHENFPSIPVLISESQADQLADLYYFDLGDGSPKKSLRNDLALFVLFNHCSEIVQDEIFNNFSGLLNKRIGKTLSNLEHIKWNNFMVIEEIHSNFNFPALSPESLANFWFNNKVTSEFISVHEFQEKYWFNKEDFEELIDLTLATLYLKHRAELRSRNKTESSFESVAAKLRQMILELVPKSKYQVDSFINLAEYPGED